jgi:molecular chaperone Hsp33
MGKVIRCLTTDATVMAIAMDATGIVARAEQIHRPSAVVTAALGRLLTAGSLMGVMLKNTEVLLIMH